MKVTETNGQQSAFPYNYGSDGISHGMTKAEMARMHIMGALIQGMQSNYGLNAGQMQTLTEERMLAIIVNTAKTLADALYPEEVTINY